MSTLRKFALASGLMLAATGLSAGPALAFNGGGGHGGGGGGFGGGHAGGFGGGHPGGFGGDRAGGFAGRPDAGRLDGDRVYTGRSVGIDRGFRGRGFTRGGEWLDYDCSPVGVEEGLCPDDAY